VSERLLAQGLDEVLVQGLVEDYRSRTIAWRALRSIVVTEWTPSSRRSAGRPRGTALHGLTNPASRWRTSVNASQAMPLKLAVFLSAPFFMLLAVVAMFCPPVTSSPNSTANTSFAISGHEGK
jgi:hypothetical protein